MSVLTESVVEDAALSWLEALGYAVQSGLAIAPGETRVKNVGQMIEEATA